MLRAFIWNCFNANCLAKDDILVLGKTKTNKVGRCGFFNFGNLVRLKYTPANRRKFDFKLHPDLQRLLAEVWRKSGSYYGTLFYMARTSCTLLDGAVLPNFDTFPAGLFKICSVAAVLAKCSQIFYFLARWRISQLKLSHDKNEKI